MSTTYLPPSPPLPSEQTSLGEKSDADISSPPEAHLPIPDNDLTALQDALPPSQGKVDAYATSFHPGRRFYFAFISLLVITLMAALDATSLSVAIPKITHVLNGTAIEGFWSGTSFLLTSTVFQPVFGSFSDIFGRKPMILLSLLLFALGAILAAVAQDMALMLAGRSIQGIGGGGVLVLVEIVVTDLVPLRFRANYFSIIGSMWAIGSVSGPLIGGAFSQEVSWTWIFWINLPFIGIGTPLVILFLRLYFKPTTLMAQLRRIDWIGMVLFIGSTTGFLIPLTWGGVMYPWESWRTLVPLLVCAAAFAVFIVWEDRFAKDPLIRTSVIKNRSAAITYFGDFIQGLVLWCSLYYMPLYFQAVKGSSAIMTGVDLFPATFTVAPAAILVGLAIGKLAAYRWAVWTGWTLATLGYGLQYLLDVHTSTVEWVFITLVAGIGTGMLYPSLTFAIQAATPNKDQAYAVSLFTFFRAAGQAVGVAIGGTIFQNSVHREILKHPSIAAHAAEWSADAAGLVEVIRAMPQSVARDDLVQSYADALKIIWIVACALAGTALISSFWTEHFDLNRELETDHGFKHEEKSKDVEGGELQS